MEPSYQLPKGLKYLCIGFQALAVLVAVLSLWIFLSQDVIDQSIDRYWQRLSPQAQEYVVVHDFKKLLLSAIATISYFAPVLILIGAYLALDVFRKGDPLSLRSSKSVRFLGATIIAYAISTIITHSAVVLALTYDNPSGQKEFSLAVNSHTLVVLLVGVIILIIGHILTEATRIAEENRQFV